MTSSEIKASKSAGKAQDNQVLSLKEIAYQIAVMNERNKELDKEAEKQTR
jgi:hypothetical protein